MPVSWWDGIEIEVSVGFSAADGSYGVWGVGEWGTATWGPDTVFTDISPYVASIQTSRGFTRELTEWSPGRTSILLRNRDGRFSPSNMDGPYVVGGLSGVRPWVPIVVKVAGVPIFTGYALSWQETYVQGSPRGGGADVTIECVDELAALARFEGFPTVPQGGGEPSGERVHRVLDNAGHTGLRAVDSGRVTLQPTTHDQNAVTEMQLVTDSEGGALYVDSDGAVTFEDRYYLVENERSREIQATFGDGGWQSVLRVPGGANDRATTPDSVAFAVTDLDVRLYASMDDWSPTSVQFIAGQTGVLGLIGWQLSWSTTSRLVLEWSTDGTLGTRQTRTSTEPPVFVDGSFHWLRATLDVNNGAAGHTVNFYTSADGINWTGLGAPIVTAGTTSIFNSNLGLFAGGAGTAGFVGNVRQFTLLDSIGGTPVANPDFTLLLHGITTFKDLTGNTWTVEGNATVIDDQTATPELPYAGIVPSFDGDQVVNIVSLSRVQTAEEQEADIDPPVVTVRDETSRALYKDARYARTDLINEADADLAGLATFHLATHKDPEQRIDQITFQPRHAGVGGGTLLVEQATQRRVRDKIRVIRRPPGAETIVRDCHIAGIAHTIDQDDWQVSFDLWSATVYDEFSASFWDEALWDAGTWFF